MFTSTLYLKILYAYITLHKNKLDIKDFSKEKHCLYNKIAIFSLVPFFRQIQLTLIFNSLSKESKADKNFTY